MSIYLIRHGARFDAAHRDYWNKHFGGVYDPPLSALGFRMIAARAKEFRDKGFDQVLIVCSPFLRCLQTASVMASGIKDATVIVDHRLAERAKKSFFPLGRQDLCDIPNHVFPFTFDEGNANNGDMNDQRQMYNDLVPFPEGLGPFRKRCAEFSEDFDESEYWDNTLIVSHGLTQRWLALLYTDFKDTSIGNPKVGQVYEITESKQVKIWPYIEDYVDRRGPGDAHSGSW